MDTLAVRLTVPPVGPVEDLHLQVGAPCRAHKYIHAIFVFLLLFLIQKRAILRKVKEESDF
jgi:hypothetical protein